MRSILELCKAICGCRAASADQRARASAIVLRFGDMSDIRDLTRTW